MHTSINGTPVLHSSDVRMVVARCIARPSRPCTILNIYFHFTAFVFPLMAFTGIATNILSIVIFARRMGKPMQRQYFLLICLSTAQIISLLLPTFYQLPAYGFFFLFGETAVWNFNQSGTAGCKALYSLYSIAPGCVANIFLIATFDRFATMRFPLRMRNVAVSTMARIASIAFLLSFAASIIYMPDVGFRSTKHGNDFTCSFLARNLIWIVYMMLVSRTCFVQLFLISLGNVLLLVEVRKASKKRVSLTNNMAPRLKQENQARRKLFSGASLQLIQSLIYLASTIPPAIFTTISSLMDYFRADPVLKHELLAWAFLMEYFFYMQNAVHFIVYLARLPKYRAAFCKICSCGFWKEPPRVYVTERAANFESTSF